MIRSCCLVLMLAVAAPVDQGVAQRPVPDADTRFMQGMIAHHAQAVEMVALIPTHSTRADMRLLGQRIDVSQRDEIAMMRRWLQDHHQEVPAADAHQGHQGMTHDEMPMPGMLTSDQMTQLAKATGAAFDTLFLKGMIQHHEGALAMVAQLFAVPGAGQQSQVFAFASDVDADQRAEINRMRALLTTLTSAARRP